MGKCGWGKGQEHEGYRYSLKQKGCRFYNSITVKFLIKLLQMLTFLTLVRGNWERKELEIVSGFSEQEK